MEAKVKVINLGRKHLALRWTNPENGRECQKSAKTADRKQAEKAAAQLEADLNSGRYAPPTRIGWDDFRDRFEAEHVPSLAVKSGLAFQSALNHVEVLIRPNRLAEITPASLSRFQAELRSKGLKETSIATHLKHLRAALGWAKSIGLIAAVPVFNLPKRVRGAKMMRGRPVTPEEFNRMLETIQSIVGAKAAASWRHYLQGLWWSGLRLGESLEVYWDRDDRLCVDLSGKFPMLRIPAEFEKGNQDRLLPMAPEFAKFILPTPEHERTGPVFRLVGLRGQPSRWDEDWVSRVVSRIGKAAAVKVNTDPTNGKIKYASAHDLRRSFGERWAHRIMPQLLKELMRHESIETTMRYYVGTNSQLTAEALWATQETKNGHVS